MSRRNGVIILIYIILLGLFREAEPFRASKIPAVLHKDIIPTARFGSSSSTSLSSWTEAFSSFLHEGSSIDSVIQGALNSATGTEARIIEDAPAIAEKVSAAKNGLDFLGLDLLAFLFATIFIVPLFKYLKESPVIGFLCNETDFFPF